MAYVNIKRAVAASGGSWDESKGDRHLHVCINDEDLLFIASEMFHFVVGKPPEVEKYVYRNWKDNADTNNFHISNAKPE